MTVDAPFAGRMNALRSKFADLQVDALLVSAEVNVRYLSGFTGDSSYLLISTDDAWMISDRRYENQLQRQCPQLSVWIRGPERTTLDLVAEAIASLPGDCQRLGLESERVSWRMQQQLAGLIHPRSLVATEQVVEQLRAIKDEGEIASLRRAVSIAEQSFLAVKEELACDCSERELAFALESNIRSLGGDGCGFAPIVACDAHSALPHAQPGQRTLGQSRVLLIDWGAVFGGYTSDITRTLHVGAASERFGKVYALVLEAQRVAIEAMRPGIALADIDRIAREKIAKAGLGNYFGHGLGHGIGLEIHEVTRLSAIASGCLEAGMVLTVEPGVYLPEEFGVRIEDDILVTQTGHEVLSQLPKGLEETAIFL